MGVILNEVICGWTCFSVGYLASQNHNFFEVGSVLECISDKDFVGVARIS